MRARYVKKTTNSDSVLRLSPNRKVRLVLPLAMENIALRMYKCTTEYRELHCINLFDISLRLLVSFETMLTVDCFVLIHQETQERQG